MQSTNIPWGLREALMGKIKTNETQLQPARGLCLLGELVRKFSERRMVMNDLSDSSRLLEMRRFWGPHPRAWRLWTLPDSWAPCSPGRDWRVASPGVPAEARVHLIPYWWDDLEQLTHPWASLAPLLTGTQLGLKPGHIQHGRPGGPPHAGTPCPSLPSPGRATGKQATARAVMGARILHLSFCFLNPEKILKGAERGNEGAWTVGAHDFSQTSVYLRGRGQVGDWAAPGGRAPGGHVA